MSVTKFTNITPQTRIQSELKQSYRKANSFLEEQQKLVEDLKSKCRVPSKYNAENPIQLIPGKIFDVTDQSSKFLAEQLRFDPDGLSSGSPLRKSIFYTEPYITCAWCNAVDFIDTIVLRRVIANPASSLSFKKESLPPCKSCGKSNNYVVGAHDFTKEILNRDREAKLRAHREDKASKTIQRAYRLHLNKMYGSSVLTLSFAERRLQFKAARTINALCRGRLGRRRAKTVRNLAIIKESHPLLLKHALEPSLTRTRCFWYHRPEEITLLYRDYLDLCQKTGFLPPRCTVERNISEIADRIMSRKHQLLMGIQRVWRGFMARRIVMVFEAEKIRLFQRAVTHAMSIQRSVRGHQARLKVHKLRSRDERESRLEDYMKDQGLRKEAKHRKLLKDKLMNAYSRERADEFTARVIGRLDSPSKHEDRKMRAFSVSVYADDSVNRGMRDTLAENSLNVQFRKKLQIEEETARKMFILSRIAEHGPRGFGNRGYRPSDPEYVAPPLNSKMRKALALAPEESSRSRSMRLYFREEMRVIMEHFAERELHNFRPENTLDRLRNYNNERSWPEKKPKEVVDVDSHGRKISPAQSRRASRSVQSKKPSSSRGRTPSPTPDPSPLNTVRSKFDSFLSQPRSRVPFHRPYRYPQGINEDPMACLREDIDDLLNQATRDQEELARSRLRDSTAALEGLGIT